MNTSVICWFEIYTEDIERAKKFYSSVLGVEFYHMPAIDDDVIMAAFLQLKICKTSVVL